MSHPKLVKIEIIRGVTVVSFVTAKTSITEDVIGEIGGEMLSEAVGDAERVLIDFTNVDFFSSSFIEVLFRTWNRLKKKPNGRFGLCSLHPYCKEILDVTNLSSVWDMYPDRETALNAMATS